MLPCSVCPLADPSVHTHVADSGSCASWWSVVCHFGKSQDAGGNGAPTPKLKRSVVVLITRMPREAFV